MDNSEQRRQEQIKELRAEIRKTKAEMKERKIKRSSCFNRMGGDTYRYNATMFQLETQLKMLLASSDKEREAKEYENGQTV